MVRTSAVTTAALTRKGQTTVPKMIREHLGLVAGDRLRFLSEPDGRVVIEAATVRLRDLAGRLPRPERPVSLAAMDEAVGQAVVERARKPGAAARRSGS